MPAPLTVEQSRRYEEFKAFAAAEVAPCAGQWDRDERLPKAALSALAARGYLTWSIPPEYGGKGADVVTLGLLHEALGKESSSLTGVLTVQSMVSMALLKWGTGEQKRRWLPAIASGDAIGAFALTEPGAGSSLRNLETALTRDGRNGDFVLHGAKRWISCGQFADVFLVFGMHEQQSVACLVPRNAPGVRVEPLSDLMGFRAAGLAELHFDNVPVPQADVVGKVGFALSHVVPVGLHYGRISTACSALGLLRGCFEASVAHAASRRIGDGVVGDLGMARTLIARMGTALEAGRLLCHNACRAEDEHRPEVFQLILLAKYFTSQAAVHAASDAVQIFGALGVHHASPVSRYYRDAKIMEIIEGTTQVHEDILGKMFIGQRAGGAGATPR